MGEYRVYYFKIQIIVESYYRLDEVFNFFLATFRKDEIKSVSRLSPDPLPIHLVVENIRMPDNLGSLLRVAAAVGCQQVLLAFFGKLYT